MTNSVSTPVNSVSALVSVEKFLVGIADVFHDVTDAASAGGAKITLLETMQFIPVAMLAPAAISSLSQIPAELSAVITADEMKQIEAPLLASEYLADSANVSAAVTDALALANQIKNFVQTYFVKK
jgi:hypothetical protein